jgi:hypothetical protein
MPLGSLVPLGYASKTMDTDDFIQQTFAVNRRALLIDTRLTPWCGWDRRWMRAALETRYHQRYQYKGDVLGNIHHDDPNLPITLADAVAGLDWLQRWLERGATLLLLCACAHYERCHRKLIYEQMAARVPLPGYTLGQRVLTPCGAGIISPHIPLMVQQARNRYAVLLDVGNPRQRYFSPEHLQPYDVVQSSLLTEVSERSFQYAV